MTPATLRALAIGLPTYLRNQVAAHADAWEAERRATCRHPLTHDRRSCGAYVGWRCLDCGAEG